MERDSGVVSHGRSSGPHARVSLTCMMSRVVGQSRSHTQCRRNNRDPRLHDPIEVLAIVIVVIQQHCAVPHAVNPATDLAFLDGRAKRE